MKVEQIYTGCLSHAAYYIQSEGEAAIFDPLREVSPYIKKAVLNDAVIKYVFETHFHADFVSGHLDLKKKTGAQIVFGPMAKPAYEALIADDGQVFSVGNCKVKVLHTPGHTLESTCYLLIDENGDGHGIITGDTLFIGDVGRPDLAQHLVADLTQDKLARMLYHSLRNKIMPLADDLIVYPNHGAGSACGKNMSKETTDTLGHQKEVNYALRPDMSEDEFVDEVLTGLTTPPGYFPNNVLMNINGYESLDKVLKNASRPLKADEFAIIAEAEDILVLDTRDPADFANGFIPGSINIGLHGSFAGWVGEMVKDINQKILLVTDKDSETEAMIRLSRVGYDHTIGYLDGGFTAWLAAGKAIEKINRISAAEFEAYYSDECIVIDVRKKSEFDAEHVLGAINIPLNSMHEQLDKFPCNSPFILYCAGGYRSMIAASVLRKADYNNISDVNGGFGQIKITNVARTTYKQPITLL